MTTVSFNFGGKRNEKVNPKTVKITDLSLKKSKNNVLKHSVNRKQTSNNKFITSKINLKDNVTVKRGSLIYSSASDSIYNQNGQKPYYAYDSSNSVVGITLTSNDNLATIVAVDDSTYEFKLDDNVQYLTYQEASKTIRNMKNKGWKQAGVAVMNNYASSGVTGFYKVKSINK